jgi:hypothetical protein
MLGLIAPTLVAIVAAWVLGGTPRALVNTRVRAWPVVVCAFALELLLYNPPIDRQAWALVLGPWIWVATKVALLCVVLLNALEVRRPWPWLVIGAGLALNTLVIVANGGFMPQSIEAASAVWGPRTLDPSRLHNVVPVGPATRLEWLGDNFPEPRWLPRANVLSVGDIVLAGGVAAWVFKLTRDKRTVTSLRISLSDPPSHGHARTSRRCST